MTHIHTSLGCIAVPLRATSKQNSNEGEQGVIFVASNAPFKCQSKCCPMCPFHLWIIWCWNYTTHLSLCYSKRPCHQCSTDLCRLRWREWRQHRQERNKVYAWERGLCTVQHDRLPYLMILLDHNEVPGEWFKYWIKDHTRTLRGTILGTGERGGKEI